MVNEGIPFSGRRCRATAERQQTPTRDSDRTGDPDSSAASTIRLMALLPTGATTHRPLPLAHIRHDHPTMAGSGELRDPMIDDGSSPAFSPRGQTDLSYDLRNALTCASGNLQLIRRQLKIDDLDLPQVSARLREIEAALMRVERLAKQLSGD